ncbi:MAG TPA: Hpt domain-containing protein [Kofleriaceae bacterium]|nr:Hpt domain-containing protein [Kofleriaceae bacterium]
MEDLYAKFLPQFVELARSRVGLAIKAAVERDLVAMAKVVRELHTLAGEAGLLGLHEVVPLARESELKAKALHAGRGDAEVEPLVAGLRQLEHVIDSIGATHTSKSGDS